MGSLSNAFSPIRLKRQQWSHSLAYLAIAFLFISISWLGLYSSNTNLTYRYLSIDGTPMQFVGPSSDSPVPGVLVAHGYCGSKQLMLGYAETLAHNGYGVLLWDLPGHGANTHPFEYDSLQSSFEIPFETLKAQPNIDATRLAVIGHSMGSGIAMEGAIAHDDDIDAVVAISPTGAPVTPTTPKNLSIQLGAWETFLEDNANRLLNEAGGPNPNLDLGKGRSLSKIQNAEHATILFKDQSHQETLDWLNQTFNLDQNSPFRDRRMAWYGVHLLGCIIGLSTILSLMAPPPKTLAPSQFQWRSLGELVVASAVAALPLKLISLTGPVENIAGLMIGGALGLWFLITGLVWLSLNRHIPKAQPQDLVIGLTGFLGLWIGFGAMAQVTWLPWFLTLHRLGLWAMIGTGCIPWFLMFSQVLQDTTFRQRLAWWLAHSASVLGGLILAIVVAPNLGFLAIMLPAFPLLLGLFSLLEMQSKSIWGCSLASAFTLSWLIVVPFPVL